LEEFTALAFVRLQITVAQRTLQVTVVDPSSPCQRCGSQDTKARPIEVKMAVTTDQTTIIYNRTFFFGGNDAILFPVESYETLKRLFDAINKADNHLITLKQRGSTN